MFSCCWDSKWERIDNKELGQGRSAVTDATVRTDNQQSVVLFDVASPLSWFCVHQVSEHEARVRSYLGELSALTGARRTISNMREKIDTIPT